MTAVTPTDLCFLCYTSTKPMAYHNLKQAYEPRLEPVPVVTDVHSVSEYNMLSHSQIL